MKTKIFLIYITVLLSFQENVISQKQDIRFKRISKEEGLSSRGVSGICQDYKGFLWVGTREGLNRYDGYQFKIYKNNESNPNSISNDRVTIILEDSHKNLLVGTVKGINVYNRSTDDFYSFKGEDFDSSGLSNQLINEIFEDRKGNIWIGSWNGLNKLIHFDPDKKEMKFRFYPYKLEKQEEISSYNDILCISEDPKGMIWIGTWGGGIRVFDPENEKFIKEYLHDPDDPGSLGMDRVNDIYEDSKENFWIGTWGGGLNLFDFETETFSKYLPDENDPYSINYDQVRGIHEDSRNNLWISTEDGINLFDRETERFYTYTNENDNINSIGYRVISDFYEDRSGGIWIGDALSGLNYYHPISNSFKKIQHRKDRPNTLTNNYIRDFVEDKNGKIWIGTLNSIDIYDPKKNTIEKLKCSSRELNTSLELAGATPLFNAFDDKIGFIASTNSFMIDIETKDVELFTLELSDGTELNEIKLFYVGGNNYIMSSNQGIYKYNTSLKKVFKIIPSGKLPYPNIFMLRASTAFLKDSKGNIWFNCDNGFGFLTEQDFQDNIVRINRLKYLDHDINSIVEDNEGTIWVGSSKGLHSINTDNDSIILKTYLVEDGLCSNRIREIVLDDNGIIWVATDNGLSKFNPYQKSFQNYYKEDGLITNIFNCCYKSSTGKIYLGGDKGFVVFHPDSIYNFTSDLPLYITDFKLYNKSVKPGNNSVLKKDILETNEIILKYNQTNFSFEFVAIDFLYSDKIQYEYMLEGFDKDWIPGGISRVANYTNIPPGKYTFTVRSNIRSGEWNKNNPKINIIIYQPFWKTIWAYLIYFILIVTLTFLLRRMMMIRLKMKNRIKLQELENEKNKEVTQLKTRFFTNVSHEFKTPLTLIYNPLETLIENETDNDKIKLLEIMKKSVSRLQRLINQLMDFRKLESGNVLLEANRANLVEFVEEIISEYELTASQYNINLYIQSYSPGIIMWFDKEKLEKVFHNLISNALKYTQENGVISIIIEDAEDEPFFEGKEGGVRLIIKDNGKGIPPDKIEKIFERFYQEDNYNNEIQPGTGIGLALSKEYVELHHGKIEVNTNVEEGAEFFIYLPKGNLHLTDDMLKDIDIQGDAINEEFIAEQNENTETGRNSILIVDDDPEIREYLNTWLSKDYEVLEASDGEQAISILNKKIYPGLIISDVMMKNMDGIEFCKKVKSDFHTCHIPIILLTAKSEEQDEIEGLHTGVDAYITKPFNAKVLKATLENLIEGRNKLMERFKTDVLPDPAQLTNTSVDEEFLRKAIQYVEENFSNTSFNSKDLIDKIGMSRTSFYIKLKALTGQSATEFIRSIRLKKAAHLLLNNKELSVVEVSYHVGFNDRSYFYKCFVKEFGRSPNEYSQESGIKS